MMKPLSDRAQKEITHYYIGNDIVFIGQPVVILGKYDLGSPNNRKIDSFIILLGKEPKLQWCRRFTMRHFDETYISDRVALLAVYNQIQSHLDGIIFESAKAYGSDNVPYESRFQLWEADAAYVRFLTVERRLFPLIESIHKKSHCDRLKEELPKSGYDALENLYEITAIDI